MTTDIQARARHIDSVRNHLKDRRDNKLTNEIDRARTIIRGTLPPDEKQKLLLDIETWGADHARLWIEQDARCAYCDLDFLGDYPAPVRIAVYNAAEIDHLLPKKTHAHLVHDEQNKVLACRWCNGSKRTWTPPSPTTAESSK